MAQTSHLILMIALLLYALSWLGLITRRFFRSCPEAAPDFHKHERFSILLLYAALGAHSLSLLARALATGRWPLANLYETLLSFSWGTAVGGLLLGRLLSAGPDSSGIKPPSVKTDMFTAWGALVIAALFYAFTLDSSPAPLAPILRSPWLGLHVTLAIVAYSGFALAACLGAVLLYKAGRLKKDNENNSISSSEELGRLALMIRKTIATAFPFMVLVMITGSLWAQQAWGSFWQWDPKETWGLITTVFYAFYLDKQRRASLTPRQHALLALLGFAFVLFCYLGVSLLLGGRHSYAT